MSQVAARVLLRHPRPEDSDEFLSAVRQSATLHGEWVHPPATPAAFEIWLEMLRSSNTEGHLVTTKAGQFAGVVNINNIVRGTLCSGSLGYYRFSSVPGLGLIREAVELVIERGFNELGLHRLEANIQPGNKGSRRLVESLGFINEGFSPAYLRVGGQWRDHDRWAIVNDSWSD